MADSTLPAEPMLRDPPGIEDQLWPIVCATAVLVGVLATVIFVNSDFDDERLLFNGYTQLVGVAALGAAIIFLGSLVKGRARRTAELAVLLSLALHAAVGLGAGYIFDLPIAAVGSPSARSEPIAESEEDAPPADYHWGQNDDEPPPEQAFEKPIVTRLRDQMPPAAQVEPRNLERPVPVAEVPRARKVDLSPLGIGAAASPVKPLEVPRPEAAKLEDLPPAQALAMARQKSEELQIPDAAAPSPEVPKAAKEAGSSMDARGMQVQKDDKYLWATVAKKYADPNNVPVPPPRGRGAAHEPLAVPLPSPEIIAQLPSQAPPRSVAGAAGPDAANAASQAGGTPARSDRGDPNLPSATVPDASLPPEMPAPAGGSPGSRLEAESNVPVERSESSHAPLGPSIASAGHQDFARGGSLLPTRRGATAGDGRAQPSIEGDTIADSGEVRAGSPDSNSAHGLPLAIGPARRAAASQTQNAGDGPAADQSARLPRTQSETGLLAPEAARIAEDANVVGAGGAGTHPGGMTSALEVSQNIGMRPVADSGAPRGKANNAGFAGAGNVPLDGYSGPGGPGAALGFAAAGPRRIAEDASDGGDNGAGTIPRARGAEFDPRATLDPVGPISGTASASRGPAQGAGPQGYSLGTVGPRIAPGGVPRLDGAGQRIGSRPSAALEPAEIASALGVAAPPRPGLGGRGPGDGSLDQVLSGDGDGTGGRGHGQFVVNSLVHEPLDAFRHGPVRGGPALGDSGDGQLTEPAIENGLAYFARTQFPDGHWSLHDTPRGIPRDPPSGAQELDADTAATGLALLSYMAAGYTHQDEKYRQTVRRGIDWLVKHQKADGDLSYHRPDPDYDLLRDPTHFYSHGIAAMALCEAYGMTQDRDLREPAQKAIGFIVRSQDPNRGGWRYVPRMDSDTSVSGWQVMALRSAQLAGLNVPEATMQKAGHWLDLAQAPQGGTYVYNPWNADKTPSERAGRAPSPTMTAQAMVMRMYLGQDGDQAVLRQGADYLKNNLPQVGIEEGAQPDCYNWYYATQAMYHMQGDYWDAWNARVTPLVRAGQAEKGPLKGSWNALTPVPDRWGQQAGRHYVTAMHILTLEIRYWHLPLVRELRRQADAPAPR